METHSRYICTFCEKKFSNKKNLHLHFLRLHGVIPVHSCVPQSTNVEGSTAFGAKPATNDLFGTATFGVSTHNTGGGLFGAASQPTGSGLFGLPSSTVGTLASTSTNTFGGVPSSSSGDCLMNAGQSFSNKVFEECEYIVELSTDSEEEVSHHDESDEKKANEKWRNWEMLLREYKVSEPERPDHAAAEADIKPDIKPEETAAMDVISDPMMFLPPMDAEPTTDEESDIQIIYSNFPPVPATDRKVPENGKNED